MTKNTGEPATEQGAKLDDLIGYQLRRASTHVMNDFIKHLEDEAMRPVPFSVLCTIAENPGTTAADISRALQLQRANIVHILADLEGRGLLERRADTDDQRIQRLFLSPLGEHSTADWMTKVARREDQIFKRLNNAEKQFLLNLLARIWKR